MSSSSTVAVSATGIACASVARISVVRQVRRRAFCLSCVRRDPSASSKKSSHDARHARNSRREMPGSSLAGAELRSAQMVLQLTEMRGQGLVRVVLQPEWGVPLVASGPGLPASAPCAACPALPRAVRASQLPRQPARVLPPHCAAQPPFLESSTSGSLGANQEVADHVRWP